MAIRIKVCTGGTCGSKGGNALLRDIEELCGLKVDCESRGCMGKCAKGPNVEVIERTGRSKPSTGLKSFSKVEAFLSGLGEELDFAPSQLDLDIGKLKYTVRRTQESSERVTRIEEGFQLLGGEDAAQTRQPLHAATLFVLRSKELIKLDTQKALLDAELAVRLWTEWPQAFLAHGAVLEHLGRFPEAVTALERAMQMRRGVDMQRTSGQLNRLKRKAQAAPVAKVEVVEDAAAAAERASSTDAQPAKPTDAAPQQEPDEAAELAAKQPDVAEEKPKVEGGYAHGYDETPPWVTPTHGQHSGLYADFGGDKALNDFVNGFYDKMAEDPNLGRFFAKFNLVNLKARTVDYMAAQWGGPEYHGPDLFTAHATMKLTENQWGIMIKCINWKLKQMGIGKALKQRVLNQIEEMHKPIIDPTGEFLAWLKQKQKEALDKISANDDMVDPSGMGFYMPKAKLEAWKAAEDRKKHRAEQMALLKAKREQEEAAAKAAKAAKAAPKVKAAPKASPAESLTAKKPVGPKKVAEKKVVASASPKRSTSQPPRSASQDRAEPAKTWNTQSAESLPTTASDDTRQFTSSGESLAPPSCFLAPEEPAVQPPSSATPRFLATTVSL